MQTKAERLGRMLTVGADLMFGRERELLLAPLIGANVASALDIGCGNGAYMARLSDAFPGVKLTGVEIDEAMYRQASALNGESRRWNIVRGGYESLTGTGPYDAIIVRLVAPHIPDRAEFARWLAAHTHDRSLLFVIDFDDGRYRGWDGLPLFSSLYEDARRQLKGRRGFLQLPDQLKLEFRQAGFEPIRTESYAIRADRRESREKCRDYMRFATEYLLDEPIDRLRERELADWLERPDAELEIPMFGIVFAKTEETG
ncbi:methyltransferase domain-containing protein [Paenibacillus sp. GYB003]|uniref:methyltransferase domain-containing protein n=1 Tax=Paenibacillus sp. GYB003 TaxID=2994392 RepID=UPI002F96448B